MAFSVYQRLCSSSKAPTYSTFRRMTDWFRLNAVSESLVAGVLLLLLSETRSQPRSLSGLKFRTTSRPQAASWRMAAALDITWQIFVGNQLATPPAGSKAISEANLRPVRAAISRTTGNKDAASGNPTSRHFGTSMSSIPGVTVRRRDVIPVARFAANWR